MEKRVTIGVLIGNANSPYTIDLMYGIIAAAEKQNVNLLFYLGIHNDAAYRVSFGNTEKGDFEYQFNVVYDYVALSSVDALVISYGTVGLYLGEKTRKEFLEDFDGIPYVLVEAEDDSGKGSSVVADNYAGMYELVEHLVTEHGCRNMVYLSGPKGTSDADQRRAAFADVMKKYELPLDDSRIAYGDYTANVSRSVCQLLDAHPDADAMVCANDLMADSAYHECKRRGLIIGTDIAVTGYDNWENAEHMLPPLSTVFQNARRMGYTALDAACDLCKGMKPKVYHVSLKLMLRASCGCKNYEPKQTEIGEEEMSWIAERSPETERYMMLSRSVKAAQETFDRYKQETWLLPLISREMMTHVEDEEAFFRAAMVRMAAFRMRKSYIFILEEPMPHKEGDVWKCPDKLYLASCQVDGKVTSYPPSARPQVTRERGLTSFLDTDSLLCMQVFLLFSGEMQYGILVTDITLEELALSYLISMQISNALKFLELSNEQKRTRKKLEKLVKEINEKNEVLNFISEYDSMTKCLNRRGFMEAIMDINKKHTGEKATLIFADVDHLKEINDSFGHIEGDYAICRIATVLLKAVEKHGIVGRIGGDEFVAVVLESDGDAKEIIRYMNERNHHFNESEEKEYYIEASVGIQEFICSDSLSVSDLLDAADVDLYRSKKKRRKTVRKGSV